MIVASSVDRFAWYANCILSMTGCVWVVILGSRALSKHLANIAVKVTGRRSLSTLGSGFFWTCTISPIFHRAYMGHSIRLIEDVIDYFDKLQMKGLMFFADFKKAFDSLDWNFMFKTLDF